ncbi:MAG: hypothetical protein AB1632_02670 [Nitrospirota bacterium]
MREDKMAKEKINLIDRELITLTEKLEEINSALKDIEDLKLEIKGLKMFLGRVYPEFKSQFPDIMKKVVKRT